jgi:hypothetical protein
VLALPVLAVVPDMATSPQGVSVRMRLLAESAGLAVLTVATAWSMWSALSR